MTRHSLSGIAIEDESADAQARESLVRRRWIVATLLFLSGFINYLDRAIISVALPVIAIELHLGPTETGTLLSAFFWSYALMQLPIGWLSDRFNLRWLYPAAFALWSLTCGFTGFARGLGTLILLRVLLGIGESLYLPGGVKIVSVLFPAQDRGLASGFINCGTRAGLALGVPLIAALTMAVGWKNSFFILGFAALIWLIPWFAVFPARANTAAFIRSKTKSSFMGRLDRNLLGLSLGHIGYGYYFYLMVTWLPAYLVQSRHLDLKTAGVYAAVPYLVFTLGEPLGGWIADRLVILGWNEVFSRKVLISLAYLTSILLIAAGRVTNNTSAVFLLGGASLVGFSTGNIYALLQRLTPEAEVGFAMGVLNLAGNISGIVAPLVTGILIARTGSFSPAFLVAVGVLLCALPIYWLLVKENLSEVK
jgi:MFS transporter, ACS family, D-galactonate transporter